MVLHWRSLQGWFGGLAVGVASFCACTGEVEEPPPAPIFPAEAPTSWREVRDCRHSHEHELNHIRVLANDAAHDPYLLWNAPFPVGATLLKLEYDDGACSHLIRYTAMKKLPQGSDPSRGDWHWQASSPARVVEVHAKVSQCVACHKVHCREDNKTGFDLTCAEELF